MNILQVQAVFISIQRPKLPMGRAFPCGGAASSLPFFLSACDLGMGGFCLEVKRRRAVGVRGGEASRPLSGSLLLI
jgi:hypothetical protein